MPTPNLGYNQKNETQIDTFNQWFRAQPQYQQQLKEWGIDPNNVHLAKSQSQQLLKMAQGMGAVVDEGDMEIDPSGNFNPKGHKLRNALIIGGVAGAALLTAGLATPLLAGGGAAGGGMAGGAAGAGAAGIGGAGAAGLGVGSGISAAGIGTGGLIGAGTLGSTAVGTGMVGGIAGGAGLAGGSTAAGGGFWSTVGRSALNRVTGGGEGGTSWGEAAKMAGSAIGKASTAAGNNRLNQEQLALQANRDNISGNTAAENALMNRSEKEALERKSALIDVARASDTRNPNVSQFNTHAPKKYSDEYMSSLTALEQAGLTRLKADPTYSTNNMPALRTYQPLDIQNLQGATNTKPGLMERIGNYAGPVLSTYAAARKQQNDDDDAGYGG